MGSWCDTIGEEDLGTSLHPHLMKKDLKNTYLGHQRYISHRRILFHLAFFCLSNSGSCETVQGLPEGLPGEKDLDTGSRPHPARPPAASTPWPARWPASHRGTQPWNTPPEMNLKNPLRLLCYLFVEVYLICYTAHEQYNNMNNGRKLIWIKRNQLYSCQEMHILHLQKGCNG